MRSSIRSLASSARWTRSTASAVGLLTRLTRARVRVVDDPLRLVLGLLLDLGGAPLGGLDDPAHLVGGGGRQRRRAAALAALQLLDGVGDLAQVALDLVGVIAAAGCREVVSLDEMAVQFHGSPL